jgi:hypothetical protein
MIRIIFTSVAMFFSVTFIVAIMKGDHPATPWGWFNFACCALTALVSALLAIAWRPRDAE